MVGIYFSGTGNTKFCIETFLQTYDPGSKCISIENEECVGLIKEASTIVFAYPIYFSNLPKIVHDFIVDNHSIFRNKEIFIISTMGLFSGDGSGCSARLFKKYGAHSIGGIHVKMPDCIGDEKALKKSLEKNKELVEKAKQKLTKAAMQLKSGTEVHEGLRTIDHFVGFFGQRLWFYGKTQKYTNKMKVDIDTCIGCGICVSKCPLSNIELKNKKAVSKGKCTMCYRCFAHCPKQAITILGKQVHEQCYIEKYNS